MKAITIIGLLWLCFSAFWAVSALSAKRSVRDERWQQTAAVRLVFVLLMIWILRRPSVRANMVESHAVSSSPILEICGIVLCAVGLSFAVWARVNLGRNWGMPMSARVDPELITTGPYRWVRHPIYTGVITALVGSSVVAGPAWLVGSVIGLAYFAFCAAKEEQFLKERFPDQYPDYAKRTKMLIPFVW